MTQEEYNQLDYDYAHCAGANCQKSGQCLHHTVYTMLQTNKHDYYTVVNPNVTTGKQPCPIYEADRKERFAWGISRIYDKCANQRPRGVKDQCYVVFRCFCILQSKATEACNN